MRCRRRCRGAIALWKTLSEFERGFGMRGTSGGDRKVGVRANRFLGPCK